MPDIAPVTADRLLLLYADRTDPVSRVLLDEPGRFGREVVAISLGELLDEVAVGSTWVWRDRAIDPSRTAAVNRLTATAGDGGPFATFAAERRFWTWLGDELGRFAYASSRPNAMSMIGCHGSLRDQWTSLPQLVDGLRVPLHEAPGAPPLRRDDIFEIDPWHLYSLGTRRGAGSAPAPPGRLAFVRPAGRLLHVAQVGGTLLAANFPQTLTAAQQSALGAFAERIATRSEARILEHAFFVGTELPVFYSTSPVPVITGTHPNFPDLLVQGLQDDVDRRTARAAP